ncbi:MAG: Cys-tRNA(Pro) deacylase [Bacilli bacterium]|nr:Cys-tRNA(Pro) deacylase [Bacilli bacterium]
MGVMDKTNVMRLLEAAKINYTERVYDPELTDGESIAQTLGEDPESVFKTLVTVSDKKEYFVFCVPVNGSLNLKKAAKAVGAKSIAMIHQKELLPLTGYIHGGCSPIGLKKPFPVTIDETARLFDSICVSGGRKGFQVALSPADLASYCKAKFVDLLG